MLEFTHVFAQANSMNKPLTQSLKTTIIILCLFANLTPCFAKEISAHNRGDNSHAIGLLIGEPTGFNYRQGLPEYHAFDIGLAFSFDEFLLTYADYHWVFLNGFKNPQFRPYAGVGGFFGFNSHTHAGKKYYGSTEPSVVIGFRAPGGIEWLPDHVPLGVFVELAIGMSIIPSTSGVFQGGIGGRYYF